MGRPNALVVRREASFWGVQIMASATILQVGVTRKDECCSIYIEVYVGAGIRTGRLVTIRGARRAVFSFGLLWPLCQTSGPTCAVCESDA